MMNKLISHKDKEKIVYDNSHVGDMDCIDDSHECDLDGVEDESGVVDLKQTVVNRFLRYREDGV